MECCIMIRGATHDLSQEHLKEQATPSLQASIQDWKDGSKDAGLDMHKAYARTI